MLRQIEKKYDLIANELALIYKCKVSIISHETILEGLVTKYHKKYREDIGIQPRTEAYIQPLVLKKTFESISFDISLKEAKVQVQIASKIIEVTFDVVIANTLVN